MRTLLTYTGDTRPDVTTELPDISECIVQHGVLLAEGGPVMTFERVFLL